MKSFNSSDVNVLACVVSGGRWLTPSDSHRISTLDGYYLGHAAQAGDGEEYIRTFGLRTN